MLVRVGNTDEMFDGQIRAVDIDGSRVAVARTAGQFFAFDDTCTHMGCSLANGRLEGTTVTCACHGSQFDVTSGAVLRGPAQRPVRSHRVEVRGSDLLTEG
jgi:nitrite reductase/ring-hydroxylating ferredoxin subunit